MKYGKVIEGNLVIRKDNNNDYSEVEKITGSLSVRAENTQLPQLSSVGGDLSVEAENTQLPQLSSVGGYLYVEAENTQLPQLSSVGGYLYVRAENTQLPQLSSVGGSLYVEAGMKFKKGRIKFNNKKAAQTTRKLALEFNFNCFLKLGLLFADGILAKILTKHTNKNGTTVYKIQIIGQLKTSYCIEANGKFAHADTIEQAKEDLKYKFQNRDTSMYKNYTLDTVVTFEEALQMYHDITGACSGGTKHFVENVLPGRLCNGVTLATAKKKKYTIAECIELTKGQYNSNKFEEFFKGNEK